MANGRTDAKAGGSADESLRARAIELWVLNALAIAQPVFAILGPNPAFFVAHDMGVGDLALLLVALLAGIPAAALLLEALAGAAARSVQRWVHEAVSGVLVALTLSPAFARLSGGHEVAAVAGTLVGAVAFVVLRRRWATGRQLLRFFAPAPLIFVAVFLSSDGVRPLLAPAASDATVEATEERPVVFLLLDELPLFVLLDQERNIDANLFPSFARLASRSVWFRNATAVHMLTTLAVPSLLTGQRVNARIETYRRAPDNLFSWLAKSHRLIVGEALTRLCPPGACEPITRTRGSDPTILLGDVGIVYGHWALPRSLAQELPVVESRWADFFNRSNPRERGDRVRSFIASIRNDDRPTLYFLHILLPHVPWSGLPSGTVYPALAHPVVEVRPDEDWPARIAFQRHVLQVGYVDRLLGELLDRLDATGLFDRALVVVTSDHGMTFQRGKHRRSLSPETLRDILHVPLFVKPPFLREGRVSDRSVESIDILPTIADALGMALPFAVEGRSMLGPAPPAPAVRHARSVRSSRTWTIDATLPSTWAGLQMKGALFGPHPTWDDVWAISSAPDLIGRRVDAMAIDERPVLSYGLFDANQFDEIAPASGKVPSYVRGIVWAADVAALPDEVAVAVDGVVRGVGHLFSVRESTEILSVVVNPNATGVFAMMLPESVFHAGKNRVEAFAVDPDRRLGRMPLGVPPRAVVAFWPDS